MVLVNHRKNKNSNYSYINKKIAVMKKINIQIINPNGTDIYDKVTYQVANSVVSEKTVINVTNLEGKVPKTAFLPKSSVLMNPLLEACTKSEKEGFDAIIIACCDDPGLDYAKELVSIPVTGPMEAAAFTSSSLGRMGVIAPKIKSGDNENLPTDTNWVRRHIHKYGILHNFSSVEYALCPHPSDEIINKYINEDTESLCNIVRNGMASSIEKEADKLFDKFLMNDTKVIFFACTIWSGLLENLKNKTNLKILDPVATPVIYAESLAKL